MKPFYYKTDNYDLEYRLHRGVSMQVHISDLHFGVIDPKTEYTILKEQFVEKIKDLPLDCISIDGDYFDRLVMSNTDAILYGNLFFKDLYNICKANNQRGIHTVLVIILGTKNHDADQLRLFYPYLNDPEVDLRIVETIQFQYINGCRVLCIPELCGISDEEYSKYLFQSGYYDMVFMHGTVEGVSYDNKLAETKTFSKEDFDFCCGPVIAGHIHNPGNYHGFFYYNGSPIRWKFGEEETKGFQVVLYDMDTRQYYVHLEPITSFRYDTINVDDIIMGDPKKVIDYINNLKVSHGIDHIRLKCTSTDENQNNLALLKDYYKTDDSVKFLVGKQASVVVKDQQTQELYNQYSYFFDNKMTPYQIFAKFVNDNEGDIIVTADQIIDVLQEV